MKYALSVVTAPTREPVSVDEAKTQLRVDATDEEGYIEGLIKAAVRKIEQMEGRTLVNTTYRMNLDAFPDDECPIKLPRPPLQSITSITYVDSTGGTTTWASSDYLVDVYSMPGRVQPAYSKTYPTARDQANAVTITYVAGYGGASASVQTSVDNVPATDKHAIKLLVSHWFENREPVNIGNIVNPLPMAVEALLSAESVGDYA